MSAENLIVELCDLQTAIGNNVVHEGLNFQVKPHEVVGIIGGSGTGKSVLLRVMALLIKPSQGTVALFGQPTHSDDVTALRRRIGMMFQSGGLFSDLSVLENVCFPLREFTDLAKDDREQLARLKLAMVGFPLAACHRYPSELSGGMTKRSAIARALSLDPELIFLDEPSAGLDPASVRELDELIITLRDSLGMTVVVISHELASIRRITDRVAFLGEGKVLMQAELESVEAATDPLIRDYFAVASEKVKR